MSLSVNIESLAKLKFDMHQILIKDFAYIIYSLNGFDFLQQSRPSSNQMVLAINMI